jgi:hypothetical protein
MAYFRLARSHARPDTERLVHCLLKVKEILAVIRDLFLHHFYHYQPHPFSFPLAFVERSLYIFVPLSG